MFSFYKGRLISLFSQQGKINPELLKSYYNREATIAIFNNQEVGLPASELLVNNYVLGIKKQKNKAVVKKRIEVDLTNQKLYAYENNQKVYEFLISSGKWGRTPTGTFKIWTKIRYSLMAGGSKELGTYYYLPNVPYVMFFYNDEVSRATGFSIHGTYWHDNFGHPMSHGCINMRTSEVAFIYYWANPELNGKESVPASSKNPGTEVIIYGNFPEA